MRKELIDISKCIAVDSTKSIGRDDTKTNLVGDHDERFVGFRRLYPSKQCFDLFQASFIKKVARYFFALIVSFNLPRLLHQHVSQPERYTVQKHYICKLVRLQHRPSKVEWFLKRVPLPRARCTMASDPFAHLIVVCGGSSNESNSSSAVCGQAFREGTLSAARSPQYQYQPWGRRFLQRHNGSLLLLVINDGPESPVLTIPHILERVRKSRPSEATARSV